MHKHRKQKITSGVFGGPAPKPPFLIQGTPPPHISGPQGCCKKMPQTGGFKQQKCILSPSWRPPPSSRCWPRALRFPGVLSGLSDVARDPGPSVVCRRITPVPASVVTLRPPCVQASVPEFPVRYNDTGHLGFRARPNPV